jgi:hypothetical protein
VKLTRSLGLTALTALAALVAVGPALGQDTTLWYRGYFDGSVTIRYSGPNPGYYYRPSRPTAYPLNEEQYSYPLPCNLCGQYHKPGAFVPALGKVCTGQGTHLNRDLVYRPLGRQLPGQYFYEKQNHYTFRSPINLGWPYMKYNQRTEPTGTIQMGPPRTRPWTW